MRKLLGLIAAAVLLTSCSSAVGVTNMSAADFLNKSQESGVVVIDVRTAGEYAQGHLANSLNIDVEAGEFETEIAKLDKSVSYAVYCRSGRRSSIAAEKMAKAGFTEIFNLKSGGFSDLAQIGAPTT